MKLVAAAAMIRLPLDTHPTKLDTARSCLDRSVTQHLSRSFDVSCFRDSTRLFDALSCDMRAQIGLALEKIFGGPQTRVSKEQHVLEDDRTTLTVAELVRVCSSSREIDRKTTSPHRSLACLSENRTLLVIPLHS